MDLKQRIKVLKKSESNFEGECVIYLMRRDQRVHDNHALLCAQKHALAKKLPLAVVFVLHPRANNRAREHYDFMLEGLRQLENDLVVLGIPFILLIGKNTDVLPSMVHHLRPDAVYADMSPLRGPQASIKGLKHKGATYVVDTHNIVPVWVLSDKREAGAYTVRPKLHKIVAHYLEEPEQAVVHPYKWPGEVKTMSELDSEIYDLLQGIPKNNTNLVWKSGEKEALTMMYNFVEKGLAQYGINRNNPLLPGQSNLSPYIHFGQVSALRIALEIRKKLASEGMEMHLIESPKIPSSESGTWQDGAHAFLEELIVRKELADNFCWYCPEYDSLDCAPTWSRTSLDKHATDPRQFVYELADFEHANTHDSAWNAAQTELLKTGKMHGYMRMYWAKKVLEWSESPEKAFRYLVYLNDFYSIDGGDPNGYAGIAWSVAGVHDRPWGERPVYGVIRCMVYDGLKRRFDVKAYEARHL